MKRLFILILLLSSSIYSQNILKCEGEVLSNNQIDETYYNRAPQTNDKYVLNVFFHIIRDNAGSTQYINLGGSTIELNEYTIQRAVAMLNITFNQFNIFFKYRGFDYIDDTSLLDIEYDSSNSNNEYNSLTSLSQYRNDAFNIFIANTVTFNSSNSAGIGRRPGLLSAFNKDYLLTATLPHEIGHNFNLLHTHQDCNTSNCEHVSGDNCATAGDRVCDTPASYKFTSQDVVWNSSINDFEYQNNSNTTDCVGDLYVNVPIKNFMSKNLYALSNYYHNLRNHFTYEQGIRMRGTIASGVLNNALTTVESLYQPYKGEYYLAGPNNNEPTKFQLGFDYKFVYCEGNYNTPSDYYDTLFTFNSNNIIWLVNSHFLSDQVHFITHPNHTAIIIEQIDSNIARKCYNNTNRTPISGTVIKFKDNVINNNIIINNMNQQEINNPNLEYQLPSGLYKIDKSYNDGSKEEKIIYKTN